MCVDAATSLAAPLLIRRGIDRGVVEASTHALWVTCLIFLAVQLVSWANAVVMTFQTSRTAERVLFSLRVRTFAHLQRLSLDYYDDQMAGRIMTRMTSDIDAFAQLVQQGLLTALVSVLSCVGVAVVLVVLDAPLALAVSIVLPPLIVATVWFRRAVEPRLPARSRARRRAVRRHAGEPVGVVGHPGVRPPGRNEEHFGRLADDYNEARRRSIEMIARFFPFIQLVSTVAKAMALGFGAHEVANGSLDAGRADRVPAVPRPVLHAGAAALQRVRSVAAGRRRHRAARHPAQHAARARPTRSSRSSPGRLTGAIRFDGVSLAYPSTGLTAVSGVDLEIPAGQVVALVGTTGAGKSTLVKLVARFYDPTAGRVTVDGIPVRDLDLAAYRHQLGYVPQEPFLFSGTVATNIAYGDKTAGDLDIERAARAVGAHDLIASLPLGYHTPIADEGRSLSAGQRQLIGLARAQLVDPAILLLDEATANLDLATEARVQEAMGLVARGRTTVLIAHRLQTARAAQRIVVLEDGGVVEDGSHDELVELDGRYASLWSAFLQTAS